MGDLIFMLLSLLLQNLIVSLLLLAVGSPLVWLLRKKLPLENGAQAIFLSLFLGFFLFETGTALFFTHGKTLQLLNFLPLVSLFFLPRKANQSGWEKWELKDGLYPLLTLFLGSVYFLKSYAPDFQQFTRQPFIDLISYGSTAFSLGQSGIETAAFQRSLFFPDQTGLGLYHFAELWFSVGVGRLLQLSETYVVSLILPVQLLIWMLVGLIGNARKMPGYLVFLLALALPFANYKTLLGSDIFLYNFLDLTGLKIGLLWVSLLALWQMQENPKAFFGLALLLPQENVLYALVLPFLLIGFQQAFRLPFRIFFQMPILLLLGAMALCGGLLLAFFGQKSGTHSLSIHSFTMLDWLSKSAVYFREGAFNLGFAYWWPAFLLLGVLYDRRVLIPLLAFLLAKSTGIGLGKWSEISPYRALLETALFALILWISSRFQLARFPRIGYVLFRVIAALSVVGGLGNVATGHMDFEQIFSLFSCAVFPVFLALVFLRRDGNETGLFPRFPASFRPYVLVLSLSLLSLFTFRWQRVEPFDASYFQSVRELMETTPAPHYAAYLSNRKLYPFPLHIQAGIPLLWQHGSAISTPLHVWEDNSWQGTEREAQVLELPFALFTGGKKPATTEDLVRAKLAFLRKFQIRILWVDKGYQSPLLTQIQSAITHRLASSANSPDFLILNPDLLPK